MIAGAMTPDHFHACARCGQTVLAREPRVCDGCRALERDRAGGEPLRLFAPAPVQIPGQETLTDDR